MSRQTTLIPIVQVEKEIPMTAKEFAELEAPGDLIPLGVDPDDWHTNRVVAQGDGFKSIRSSLAPGQVCDWGDGKYRLGLSIAPDGLHTVMDIPKTDLNDPADFSSVKVAFPPESKIVSLTATTLEIAD